MLLALLFIFGILAVVLVSHMFFVTLLFLIDKFLNKGKLKFSEYIKYW